MKKIDLTCPRCSGIMTLDASRQHAVCEYCGHQVLIEKSESPDELKKRQEAKSYAYFSGKFKAEEEAQKRAKKSVFLKWFLFGGVILLLAIIGWISQFYSKPFIEDPFAYLMVSFEGTDGDGELKMKVSNDAPDEIDMALVSFHTESQSQLSEGDIIVIVASSSSYRLGTSTKRYKVEGLECYLKDVNSLDEKQLDSIFADNESIQAGNVEMVLEEDETLQIKPRSLICHNNKTENELYLISEVSFAVTNKKYFTVSKWENVVINSTNGNLVLSYGNNMGNLTSVKSWRSAMLYADYNSAVMAVENEQSSQEEVSMRSFE